MDRKNKLFLIIIFLSSLALRISHSNSYPPLLWDEAALGYNAYSISETGRDEYGQLLPIIFKSFGDYKPGLYIYLALPFVKLLGLTPLSIRLPSILAGSFLPLLLFFLVKELLGKQKKAKTIAFLSALALAFSPSAIHFSRGAWETNILAFELTLAALFFVRAFRSFTSRSLFFSLSALVFGLSFYTYQGAKLTTPLLVLALLTAFFKDLKKPKILKGFSKAFLFPLLIFFLPIIISALTSSAGNRLKVMSLTSYPRPPEEIAQIKSESSSLDYLLFHSQPVFFLRGFTGRYFNHFSPRYLAFSGDWQNARHAAPYIGLVLYPSLIFATLGFLFSLSRPTRSHLFFILWLIFAPIPAALSRDSVSAVRSMSQIVPLAFFTALGLKVFFALFKNKLFKTILLLFILSAYLLSFLYYLDLYHHHLVKHAPKEWLYGHQEVMEFLTQNQDKYQEIIFSNFYGQPYIYYLFYSSYPPAKYQAQARLLENEVGDTGQVEKIDNISFRSLDWKSDSQKENALLVFSHDEILRQGLDKNPAVFSQLLPMGQLNNWATFYLYQTNSQFTHPGK